MADSKDAAVGYIRNSAQFPMIDAIDGTRFGPGDVQKVANNKWIDVQVEAGILIRCDADGAALVKEEPKPVAASAPAGGAKPAP